MERYKNWDAPFELPPGQWHCPVCDVPITLVFRPDAPKLNPAVGDLTVCYGCTAVLRCCGGHHWEAVSDQDLESLPEDVRSEVNRARRHFHEARNRRTN